MILTDDELADARDDLEAEFRDIVEVRRPSGTVLDEDPNSPTYMQEIATYTVLYPAGDVPNGLVTLQSGQSRIHQDVGDRPVVTDLYHVTITVTAVDIRPQDEVRIVDSADARLAGRILWVQTPRVGTLTISRRLVCVDVPTGG